MAGKARATVGVRLIAEEQAALRRVAVRVAQGIRATVGAPVSVAGRPWGVMTVASTRGPLPAGTEAWLASFAELAATAIANAQARTELRSFAEEQAALRRVATLVARSAAPEQVFAAVTEEAGRLLAADIAALTRYAPDDTETIAGVWDSTGAAPVAVGARVPLGGRNVSSLVFARGRPGSTTTPPPVARSATLPVGPASERRSACRSASRASCGGA